MAERLWLTRRHRTTAPTAMVVTCDTAMRSPIIAFRADRTAKLVMAEYRIRPITKRLTGIHTV